MRSFLVTAAAILLVSGAVALTRPRVRLVSSPSYQPAYGVVYLGFGATALWGALAWTM
jgi:hypothetical protein